MSSEIFYDKAFIRVDDRYIPVVNHGSSNCFDFDSRGREIPESIGLSSTIPAVTARSLLQKRCSILQKSMKLPV